MRPRPGSPTRPTIPSRNPSRNDDNINLEQSLLQLLANPNIASKRWIIRQYDHEVQGNTIIKPLVGPTGVGPGDASVIQPVPASKQGLAIANGMATSVGDPELGGDPYQMAMAAIDECVRNLVCVGADPNRIAILDNFCWPSCNKPENLASLVRAAVGCYDAAKAYRTPFISGKDSLNNQFTTDTGETIEIPPTLLISGVGIVPDVRRCVTMDAKHNGGLLWLVGSGSIEDGPHTARMIASLIERNIINAAHDCSDGGALVAIAEMLIAADGALGANITADIDWFCESPARYIVETDSAHAAQLVGDHAVMLGALNDTGELSVAETTIPVSRLTDAFHATLDW